MTRISPVTLRGKYVTLEPLVEEHHDGLVEAASDGELWNLWYTAVPRPEEMHGEIQRRLAMQEDGSMVPFTTRLNDGGFWRSLQQEASDQLDRLPEL